MTPRHVTGPISRPNGVTGHSPGASRPCSAVGFSIRHRTFARCSYPVIMSLGVKLDLSQPIPTDPGDAASRQNRPKPLLMGGGAAPWDSLLNHYGDPQMEGNPQNAGRMACLGMNPIAGVFLPPRAVFIRVGPKPIGTPIRSYCTIADQFLWFLRGPPCFEPILRFS